MAFDPLSWAIGFALTRTATWLLQKARAETFADRLRQVVTEWSRSLPKELSDLDPEAIAKRLFETDSEPLGPKRRRLQECFERESIPDEDLWFDAIWERKEEVYHEVGNDAQRFFRADAAAVEPHIRQLAQVLHRECIKNEDFFKVTLIGMVKELVDRDRQRETHPPHELLPLKPQTPGAFLQANVRDAGQATNPGTLLNARYEIVPFFDQARATELNALQAWCAAAEPATSVRLFYGPGGTGKTRLFIEWAKRLREQGWYAGFLPERVDEEQVESLRHTDKPTLAVLDYAECRTGLFELLKRMAERAEEQKQRLRVALLARQVGDWWQSLLQRDDAVRHLLTQAEPTPIAPVTPEGALRQHIWEHARDAFSTHLQKSARPALPDLADPRFGRILYLHMSALAAVEGLETKAESLLEGIVAHEKHFWARRYQEQFGADDFEAADFDKRCSRLVAAVTLQGGMPSRDAAEELNRRVEGPKPHHKHLILLLRFLYPGRARSTQDLYLAGLEPDLLGETLVWSVLTDPENRAQAFLEQVFTGADELGLANGFIVLGRISLQDPRVAAPWLRDLLDVNIPSRARPAFLAALALGTYTAFSPLGLILARALQREGTLDHAREFDPLVPEQTVSLREIGVWTGQRLLESLATQEDTQENLTERARLLNNVGNRLSDLGRQEEALQAAQEGVAICRRLAQDRTDALLPYLALSLNNLGNSLRALGQREEALQAAQEAAVIRGRLARDRPDAYLPDLAMSLNNLGTMLSDLRRGEDALRAAQEGVAIYRRLARDRPDAFLPDLAMSLNNLGIGLRDLGRREEALQATQEGVDIRRRLAQDRPDAFLPDLAASLNSLGTVLSVLARSEEALQATQEGVDIYRRLAQDRPDAFSPDLAASLNNLGVMLRALGQREEALQATQEGVDIHRRLAQDSPDAFLPCLATSLNNLGNKLRDLGRREEALQATQEAVDIRRRLAQDRPHAFLPDLASSLNNLGMILDDLGRREEALQATQEAVAIYRRLAQDRADVFLPDLATSLGALGMCLAAATRLRDAVEAFADGVRALAAPFLGLPEAFAPLMGALVSDYMTHVKELGESPDMDLLAPVLAKLEEVKGKE